MKNILIVDFGKSRAEKIKDKIIEFSNSEVCRNFEALKIIKKVNFKENIDIDFEKEETKIFVENLINNKELIHGIILGGGSDVMKVDSQRVDDEIYNLKIPVYGLCSGMEYIALHFGGKVGKNKYDEEIGRFKTFVDPKDIMFKNLPKEQYTHMYHTYNVESLPKGFVITAKTRGVDIAAFSNYSKKIYGTIFHPEGKYSEFGKEILKNFIDSL